MAEWVICGLGNPGEEYARTRHNAGFLLVDALARRARARWSFARPEFARAHANIAGVPVLLVRPLTWMNRSGEALRALSEEQPVDPSRLLVACDDIALPEETIRLRARGSDGGHNGLKSVIAALGTTRFARLRMGVGAPPEGVDAADWVLEPLDDEAMDVLGRTVRQAERCVRVLLEQGIDAAMTRFNARARKVDGA